MYIKKTALATTIGLMFSGTALFAATNSNTEYGDYNTNTQKETTVIGESNYVSKGKKSDVEFKLKEKSDLEKDTKEKKDKLNKVNDEIDETEKKAGTTVKKQKNIDNAKKQKDDAEKNKKEHDPIYNDLKDKSDNAEKLVTEKQEKLYQVLIKASKDGLSQDKIPLHADEIVKVVNEGMSGEMTITKDDAIEYLTTMRQAFGDAEPLNQLYKDSKIGYSDVLSEPSSSYEKQENINYRADTLSYTDKNGDAMHYYSTYISNVEGLLNSKDLLNLAKKVNNIPMSKMIERMKATGNEWTEESKEIWGKYIDDHVYSLQQQEIKKKELDEQVKLVAELNTKLNKDSNGNIIDDDNNKLYQKAVDNRIMLSKEWEQTIDRQKKTGEALKDNDKYSPDAAIARTISADLQHINDVKSGYVDKDIKIKKVIEAVGNEHKENFKKAESRKKEIDNEIYVLNKIIDENKLTEDEKKAKEEIDKLNKEKEDLDNEINDNLNKIKELGEPIGENSVVTGNKNLVLGNNTVVIGNNNETMEDNNIAIGHNNVISGIDSTSFGHNNTITGKNSTAIGSNITISSDNVVAVGSKEITRKIINMSDGEISENSKEAVNGGQLYDTTLNLAKYFDKDAKIDKDGNVTNIKFNINGKEFTNINEALIEVAKSKPVSEGTGGSGGTNIDIGDLEKNIVIIDSEDGKSKIISLNTKDVQFDNIIINNDNGQITGVKDGSLAKGSTDVVTGDQLFSTNQKVSKNATGIENINNTLSTGIFEISANGEEPYKVTKDSTVNFGSKSGNIKITQKDGDFNFDLGDSLVIKDSITINGSNVVTEDSEIIKNTVKYDSDNMDVISLNNIDGTIIKNVKDGEISKGSMDAINGGQISDIVTNVSERFDSIDNKVNTIEKRLSKGIASSVAMNIDYPELDAGESTVGVGIGGHGSDQALAVGGVYLSQSGKVKLGTSFARAFGKDAKATYRASFAYKF